MLLSSEGSILLIFVFVLSTILVNWEFMHYRNLLYLLLYMCRWSWGGDEYIRKTIVGNESDSFQSAFEYFLRICMSLSYDALYCDIKKTQYRIFSQSVKCWVCLSLASPIWNNIVYIKLWRLKDWTKTEINYVIIFCLPLHKLFI
jgi:hypothetical protein